MYYIYIYNWLKFSKHHTFALLKDILKYRDLLSLLKSVSLLIRYMLSIKWKYLHANYILLLIIIEIPYI